SVLPQGYFLEKVGGDRVEVTVVVPPGASPATYEPSPSDMRAMSEAEVWFTVGVAFEEPWLPRFTGSNPDLRVVSTISEIERRPVGRYSIESLDFDDVDGDRGHTHDEGSPDPHVWLSPELVRSQASVMARELAAIDPSAADFYIENLESFQREIDSLQNGIHSLLDTLSGRSFMVFHPAWGYFADEFGLIQVPVESGGSEPSPGEMALLVDYARANGISTIFVSPQFSTSSARAIASEIHGEVSHLDPLARDWADNLLRVAERLAGRESR
ncbi:MAG: zinc ABC transporter substrate-binding protein, partial [Candidatus Fermentibacteraceae bacterium]|nr:zinc ABC transporter substrate-binding protein [Candidatus Fermentibacteraceae bacterium]